MLQGTLGFHEDHLRVTQNLSIFFLQNIQKSYFEKTYYL